MKKLIAATLAGALALSLGACNTPEDRALGGAGLGDMMDKAGNKSAQIEISMIKVAAPNMALRILDDAIQAHGGGGVSQDFHLAHAWAAMRTLRFADGPDEVHNRAIARAEFGKYGDYAAERPTR